MVAAATLAATPLRAAGEPIDCVIDPSETVKVGSPITGVLTQVLVKRGDAVSKGQEIALLESDVEGATVALTRRRSESTARIDGLNAKLSFARARLARAAELRDRQIVALDRYEELQAESIVSAQELVRETEERALLQLELQRAEAILRQRSIRSPIDGIVVSQRLSAGEYIGQDGHVLQLARLDPLHVEAFLSVDYFPKVRVGMKALVHPNPPISGAYEAILTVVDQVFDPASSTFGVRFALPNPRNGLPAGQRCKLTLQK
jgi:RND family efflux transporter MFP subunit